VASAVPWGLPRIRQTHDLSPNLGCEPEGGYSDHGCSTSPVRGFAPRIEKKGIPKRSSDTLSVS
jgi:hypothetical protein